MCTLHSHAMQSTLPYNMKAALRAQRSMRYRAPTDNKAPNTPKAQWYVIKGTHTQSILYIYDIHIDDIHNITSNYFPGTRYLVPGSWYQVPGLGPGTRYLYLYRERKRDQRPADNKATFY